jgi:integrase
MLTDMKVRKAEGGDRAYKLFDQRGLYIFVTRAGFKSWRFKYRFEGKHGGLVLGSYPDMSLREAREVADAHYRECREGRDPALNARRRKLVGTSSEYTFETMALRWHEREKTHWRPVHADDVLQSLKRDAFPDLGPFPIDQIDRPLLLAVLQKVEKRGAIETAHRMRQRCEAIFNMAISLGAGTTNPAAGLTGALKKKPVKRRWPAITNINDIRLLLREVDTAGASPITRAASRFLALTAQRPGMVRKMKWSQVTGIDWLTPESPAPSAVWTIPAEEMKLEIEQRADDHYDHDVPLAPASVELLRAMRTLTGAGDYIFWSSRRSRDPISENAIAYLYKRLGYQGRHVPHGWRSSFSTIMNELYADTPSVGVSWERIIDMMLAHLQTGVSASELRYNRAKYAPKRREVAERWSELLLEGATPAGRVVSGPRRPKAR